MPASPLRLPRACLTAALLACAWPAQADEAPWLPDSAEAAAAAPAPKAARLLVDLGLDKAPGQAHANVGVDAALAHDFGNAWLLHAGARLDFDARSQHTPGESRYALTLRELFLRHDGAGLTVDAGRMNLRDGVALGYNPSEFFRSGALPVQRTRDPQQLRDSRLGIVALRVAARLGGSELALAVSPALDVPQDPSWHHPRWGAVNDGRGQWLLKWTPPRWREVYTNLLWQRQDDGTRSLGLNATGSVGSAVVAYAEAARTQRPSLVALAADGAAPAAWHTQAALGLSLTTEQRQTFTVEWQHNGAGLSRSDWRGPWQQASAAGLGRAFLHAGNATDPLGRDSLMLALQWDRVGSLHADLNALVRTNLVDSSRLGWVEWRYRQPSAEWALNLTLLDGGARSEFGAAGPRWSVGLRWRHFL